MIFRRKKIENPLQDTVAAKMAAGIMRVQTIISDRMNKLKYLKIILISFCIVSAGLSIYFLVSAIVTKPKPAFKIDNVRMPQHFDRSGDEVMDSKMPEDIYREIQQYRYYMDSIGEPIRPGLDDSMRLLEQIYLQQQKIEAYEK